MSHGTRIVREALIDVSVNASLSEAVEDLRGYRLAAIQMPDSFDGTSLTFQANSQPGDAYQNVHDAAGNEITVTAAAGEFISMGGQEVEDLVGAWGIKVRSGTSGTPVTETADRVIELIYTAY